MGSGIVCPDVGATLRARSCSGRSDCPSTHERFSEAVLGRPAGEYCEWIAKHDTWGGGIELAILAEHFAVELAAFDVQTKRVDVFGQGSGYATRVYLLYDGLHYDLIVRQLVEGASQRPEAAPLRSSPPAAVAQHAWAATCRAALPVPRTAATASWGVTHGPTRDTIRSVCAQKCSDIPPWCAVARPS